MYVCICKSITEQQVVTAVEQGATGLRDLQKQLGVATQCGACTDCARTLLRGKAAQTNSRHINQS